MARCGSANFVAQRRLSISLFFCWFAPLRLHRVLILCPELIKEIVSFICFEVEVKPFLLPYCLCASLSDLIAIQVAIKDTISEAAATSNEMSLYVVEWNMARDSSIDA